MRTGFRISSLVPSGLVFDGVSDSEDSVILAVRSEAAEAQCPLCGTASRRVHSRYIRHVADLPSQSRLLSATVCRSRRSSAAQDVVAIWFAKLVAAALRISSAPVKAPWMG